MKKLTAIAFMALAMTAAVLAQSSKDEQEILKIHNGLDQAFLKKDAAVFERILADDYVYSTPTGKLMNRAESLEDLRKEFANTTYKFLAVGTDGVKAKVSGNMAFVTASWTTTTSHSANAEPHKDIGRYTGVYEKRNGNWRLVAEHFSEAPHDRKLMEQQVLKAGQHYVDSMKRKDRTALDRTLADEYMYTNEEGKTRNKAEDLTYMTSPDSAIELAEISDRKVRVIGNAAAVETGIYRIKGTSKGQPFDETGRFTSTWIWRAGRWQVVADHTSEIKK